MSVFESIICTLLGLLAACAIGMVIDASGWVATILWFVCSIAIGLLWFSRKQ